ncbi:MAG: DUF262 domain-containing protein [Deferrisomatales bacterium]
MYQTGGTIKEIIELVQRHEYVLPAIQREFVWKPEQIQRLFDSLMQGYPFGTFLLWRVEAENSAAYKFYDFVRDYHERDNPHCPPLPKRMDRVTAVLDGQQRLTALNIGLCGSMAIKQPYKWWNNPGAFPTRHLYLDLLGTVEPSEEGDRYRFEFLTEEQLNKADPLTTCWFKVADVLSMEDGPPMLAWLIERLAQNQLNKAFSALTRLHKVVHTEHLVAYYEVKSQDLSTVLNIFIRMNSGGTVLSYSDLLLSIAVAQWQRLDARQEIHSLVDELNKAGDNFAISQDLVLKAGLVLTNIGNVGFKVENFNHENMAILENQWPKVKEALLLTVRLIASFGFNGQNLRAHSAILPIAYYLCQLAPGDKYLTTAVYSEDREKIRIWLTKSILKASGIWGSGLDTLLTLLRDTIEAHGQARFPVDELEAAMARRGKALVFEDEELEELVELKYGEPRTFALLSLLFPFVDFGNHFHVDHIFPRAHFTKPRLRKAGLSEDEVESCQEMRDGLANLQLLDGAANISKQQSLPAEWLATMYPDDDRRASYRDKHLLGQVPDEILDFPKFFEERKARLRERVGALLARSGASGGVAGQDAARLES